MSENTACREAFEADYFGNVGACLARERDGDGYKFSHPDAAWRHWQAAWLASRKAALEEAAQWMPIETAPKTGSFLAMDEFGPEVWSADAYWASVAEGAHPALPRNEAKRLTLWARLPDQLKGEANA